ncbi:redoxin domain-containing protein [Actinoplanes sp. NPDC023801]|uniref:TlpA family protein disulfide reductase n=1 Tax=Actinoplanes sp. NPDC023801 TaxID=3154595 RepID=UPI0034011A11
MPLALAAALAAAGCGSSPAASPETPAAGPSPAAAAPPASGAVTAQAVTVPKTLKFTGTTLQGKKFDAASMAGKPAILWFWAPWCATCASEAQSLADIHEEYTGRLSVLGIASLGSAAEMDDFVADFSIGGMPHLDDKAGKLWKRFGIAQQSWYVMLDRTGKVVHKGYLDDLQLTGKVKELTA